MATTPFPEADDPELNRLIALYLEQVDAGASMSREQFIAAHPEHAAQLSRYFENAALVDQLAQKDDTAVVDTFVAPSAAGAAASQQTVVRGAADSQTLVAPVAGKPATEGSPGGQFGRYRIVKTLGQGAMGAVYLAHDSQLDRQVAIKVPKFSGDPGGEMLQRFYREARAAATLRNPNICPVFDVGEIDGQHYISMAFIQGRPLKDFSRSSKRHAERQIAVVIRKLALALAEAHQRGIIHRDLKPANIMMDEKGEPVVMDFGLARRSSSDEVQVTQDGAILGTPAYMSPEQIGGDAAKIGPQTDVYSLGVITYELITGQLPFQGSLMSILKQISVDEPPAPSSLRAGLDPALEAICLQMMAKDPAARYPSMEAVARDLTEYLRQSPRPAAAPTPATTDSWVSSSSPALRTSSGDATISTPPPASAGRRRQHRRSLLVTAGLLAAVLLCGAATLLLRVGDVDVQVVIDDPSLAVRFDGQTVTFEGSGSPIRVKPGGRRFIIERDGLEVKSDEFTVVRKGRNVLHVSIVDGQVAWDQLDAPLRRAATGPIAAAAPPPPLESAAPVPEVTPQTEEERAFQQWLSEVAALPIKDQVEAVRKKLVELNPGFDGNFLAQVERDYVTEVSIHGEAVVDISPLRAWVKMPITQLDCSNTKVVDLSPLTGMKLNWLACTDTNILTLEPLRGIPLQELYLDRAIISDLSPLEGMKLTVLSFNGKVSDLSPLRGMPLRKLSFSTGDHISDLSPLEGMPLRELRISYEGKITDLSPLRGMPLTALGLYVVLGVTDLSPLEGMPLTELSIIYTRASDLSPLKGMRLTKLWAVSTPVEDLSPLAGMPLELLGLTWSKVSDLSPLRGMPLRRIELANTPVSDLAPLTGMPLEYLELSNLTLTDLSPLAGTPLAEIQITGATIPDRELFTQLSLKRVHLDYQPDRDAQWLRAIPTLEWINGKRAAEFWKEVAGQ